MDTKELQLEKSFREALRVIQFGTHDKSLSEDGSSELEEEQFSQTHGGITAMTSGGDHCDLGSHPI